jgi:aminoglycoside phosphotransferase (APT) family kinase protein
LVRRRQAVRPAACAAGLGQLVLERLRACVESGDFAPLADAYADGVVLDISLPGSRRKLEGAATAVEVLANGIRGPGRLVEWTPAVHPGGIAVWFERVGEDGAVIRQRHYMHDEADRVVRHWVYAARPHTAEPDPPAAGDVAERLFAGLGRIAERSTLASSGWSGNRIDRLVLEDGRTLIAKRIVPGSDWIGRATRDPGREALLFADGSFARLRGSVDPAVIAAEREGDAWWVVMRDVSAELLDADTPLTREQNRFVMTAAADLWNEFWDDAPASAATLAARLAMAGPTTAERERDGVDVLPKQLDAAWEAFADAVEADVGEAVLALAADPGPLASALEERGATLIHGDLRDENVGLPEGRLVLLDWGLATRGHPAVELAWYMVHDVWRIDASHDEVVDDFRRAMGERDDRHALELGLVAGLVMYGWIFGHSAVVHPDPREREWARTELDWWVPRVRRALDDWR